MAKQLSEKSLESFNQPVNKIDIKYNNSVTGKPITKPLDFIEQNRFLFLQKVKQSDKYNTDKSVYLFGLHPSVSTNQKNYENTIKLAMITCYLFHYQSPVIKLGLTDRIERTISILELSEDDISIESYTDPKILDNSQYSEAYNMMRRFFIFQNWYAEEFRTTLEMMERTLDMAFYQLANGSISEDVITAMIKLKESKIKHYDAVLKAIADSKMLWKFSSSLIMDNQESDNTRDVEREFSSAEINNFDSET